MYLCSGFPENRGKYLRQIPEEERQDDGFQVEGREGHFQLPTSLIDYYSARPKDSKSKYSIGRLEKLCYAEFCMKYDKVAEKSISQQKWQFEELKNEEGKVVSGIGYAKNTKEKYPLEGLPQYFFILYNKNRIYFPIE